MPSPRRIAARFPLPRSRRADLTLAGHLDTPTLPSGRRILAITSAFQADEAGSIPAARSNPYRHRLILPRLGRDVIGVVRRLARRAVRASPMATKGAAPAPILGYYVHRRSGTTETRAVHTHLFPSTVGPTHSDPRRSIGPGAPVRHGGTLRCAACPGGAGPKPVRTKLPTTMRPEAARRVALGPMTVPRGPCAEPPKRRRAA